MNSNVNYYFASSTTCDWLVLYATPTSLNNMSSSVGIMIPNIWKKHVPHHQPCEINPGITHRSEIDPKPALDTKAAGGC